MDEQHKWPDDSVSPLPGDIVTFKGKRIDQPSFLYLSRDDKIVVRSICSVAGIQIGIRIRVLLPEGRLTDHEFFHSPNSNRTVATSIFEGVEGFIVGAAAILTAGTAQRGQVFLQMGFMRGTATDLAVMQMPLSNYLQNSFAVDMIEDENMGSVEGPGAILSVAQSNPAAGADFIVTVPTGARWRVQKLFATLVTSAAVATRSVDLIVDDGANILWQMSAGVTQAASLTDNYILDPGGTFRGTDGLTPANVHHPLGPIVLSAGMRIRSSTASIQAADQWSAIRTLVEEWQEP